MKLFSYVVEHDDGHAPNPYFGACTLCRCKYRKHPGGRRNVVELAKEARERGEIVWVVGTGGADRHKSAGNGKLVYAMRVDEVLSRSEYYKDRRFARKKPLPSGSYEEQRGDNIRPRGKFKTHERYVLVSRHFYYFGKGPKSIPASFPNLEKTGPSFRSRFDNAYVERFVKWIESHRPGQHGEPCMKESVARRKPKACKSSC